MALRTVTVKSAGGDYTTLAAALTGEAGNLVTLDRQLGIECYSMADSSHPVVGSGFTVDATRYIRIYTPASERHDGKRNTAKYRLHTTGVNESLYCDRDYLRLDGLQIKNATNKALDMGSAGSHSQITSCLIYDSAGNGCNFAGGNVNNTVFMNNTGVGLNRSANTCTAENCVFANNGGIGVSAFTVKNCYSGGNTGADYSGCTLTTSYSEDGTQSSTTAAWSTSSGGYFTNVTATTEDVSISTSSTLKDAGTDLSADAGWVEPGGNVDIIGTARPQGASWDIGAFEFITAATSFLFQPFTQTSSLYKR